MKRGGGRRYYRPDDVDLLRGIRHLLYGEGYTIRGVQRILKDHGVKFVQSVWQAGAPQPHKVPPHREEAGDEATAAPKPREPQRGRLFGVLRSREASEKEKGAAPDEQSEEPRLPVSVPGASPGTRRDAPRASPPRQQPTGRAGTLTPEELRKLQ